MAATMTTNGRETERGLYENLTEKELKAMKLLRKLLIDGRLSRAIGESGLKIEWYNGGVTKVYTSRSYLEDMKD